MTYCFACPGCAGHFEDTNPDPIRSCVFCGGGPVRRDYRAESAGVQTLPLKREREAGGPSAVRDKFLPTAKDYADASDPDGSRGIRQWNEEHDPKPGNRRPMRPEAPRKYHAVS